MLPLVGIALVLAMSFAAPAWAAEAVTGSAEKDGALYTFEVADGEATITKVEKAPGNAADTYEALIPSVVGKGGGGEWQALSGVTPDGSSTFLVTAIGNQAAGGRVYADTATTEAVEYNDEITRIVIPGMVTEVGDNAFAGCRKATEVVFDVDDIVDAEEHASHLEGIGDYAFAGCSSVAAWDLPDSLLHVGTRAFYYGACDSITRLKLPAAPTQWATTRVTFSDMPLCTEIMVPEGCVNFPNIRMKAVERIKMPSTLRGDVSMLSTSGGVTNLKSFEVEEGCVIDTLLVEFGDVETAVVPEGVKSVYLRGPFTQVELPSTLTSIRQIFAKNLRSIDIPASVRSIGAYAFVYDVALESVAFSPFGSLHDIDNYAFSRCSSLSAIDLPVGLTTMGAYVFDRCDALEEVRIPASVSSMVAPGKSCSSLRKVAFGAGSFLLDPQAIAEDCPVLEQVALPDKATRLNAGSDFLLSNCPAVERVYTFNPDFTLSASMFPGCGDKFAVYGWGVDGNVLNSCEESGLEFVPYAELDASGHNGTPNVEVVVEGADAVRATCRFSTPLSFDYERELVAGEDYTLSKVERDGLAYLRLIGNGATCFGEVEVPAMQDLASASFAAIGRQVVSGGRAARPRPCITLGGRALAVAEDAQLLVVSNAGGLTSAQKAAVSGWGATRAIVVGGAAACGAGAVGDLEAAGLVCEEVGASSGGAAALSVAVASAGSDSWGSTAVVANPADPVMCLAAAAYAGTVHGPLVFTGDDGTLSAEAASALAGFADVAIAGDFAAVDASLESSLPAGATAFWAESPSVLVAHGEKAGIYSTVDATYTVAARDASANIPYAASAGRAKALLTVS